MLPHVFALCLIVSFCGFLPQFHLFCPMSTLTSVRLWTFFNRHTFKQFDFWPKMMSGRQNLGMIIENEDSTIELTRIEEVWKKSVNQLFFRKSNSNVVSNWKWFNFQLFSNHKRSKFVVYFPYIFQNLKTSKIPWHSQRCS